MSTAKLTEFPRSLVFVENEKEAFIFTNNNENRLYNIEI